MIQSLKTRCVSRTVLGLLLVSRAGRMLGYAIVGGAQKLDSWAESWLVSHVRRENDVMFRGGLEAVQRTAGQEPPS